jgi:uncharacterized protein (TIGR02118 family)
MVSYPNKPGARFDEQYYLTKHMPMVAERLAKYGMTGYFIDKGVAGGAPGSSADILYYAQLNFASIEGLQASMATEAAGIMADIPNYTDIQPTIQINQVLR